LTARSPRPDSVSENFYESTPIEKEKKLTGVFRDIRDYTSQKLEKNHDRGCDEITIQPNVFPQQETIAALKTGGLLVTRPHPIIPHKMS